METLEKELDTLIDKLNNSINFRMELENISSVYPFSKYEYIISTLLSKNVLSFDDYLELRDTYINRNLYLYLFEMAPRTFGDTWGLSHLMSLEPCLQRPNKKIDPTYQLEYDLYLPCPNGNIKVEVKASRAQDRDKADEPMIVKAFSSKSKGNFLMNFQQLKPSCCDVFIWIAAYRDSIKYWVLKNSVIQKHHDFTPQHRNENTSKREKDYDKAEIYEGQIMITNANISSIKEYMVNSRGIRQAVIEQFEA
ncbi:hypothetical protein [Leadbettera azotonutricia]|uniref:Uncharacterized protein n=1 Tax=Leadbettera azotonutricia (strain ATCC BAA-888 / DSM 13862 / ZAS-9) TaxID=545695 RepID=F5YGB3_LEAAZ|nr:hypothetical protein [Leadbettera azotonutricia]AEF81535.1 hypothetical protein TREAZ_2404 [Leadbettera azotonutricia ZAS-9]